MRPGDRRTIEVEWYHSDLPCYDSMDRFELEFYRKDDELMEQMWDIEWGYDDSWDGREWDVRKRFGRHRFWMDRSADRYRLRKIDMMSFYSPSELVRRKIRDYFSSKR